MSSCSDCTNENASTCADQLCRGVNNLLQLTSRSNNSTTAQRSLILSYMQTGAHLTTIYARECMGIMHPAMRICELRKSGHQILTHWRTEEDRTGKLHRVAEYVLMPQRQKELF